MNFATRLLLFTRRWSPLDFYRAGEQGGWWDASDLSTQFQDSAGTTPVTAVGQPVGRILDKSGRGNHRTQATAASRPTLRQDASGYYYLEYDGVDDSMATGSVDFSATDKMTVWAGVHKASDAAAGILCELTAGIGTNNGAFSLAIPNGAAANNISWASKGTAQASCVTGAVYASPVSVVIAAEADIANDICRQRVSGVSITNSGTDQGTGNYSNAVIYFGRRNNASLPFNGREYQTIIRGAATDATQIARAERFIAARMGISL